MLKLVKLSLGAIGQYLIATSSWVFLVWVVTSLGEEVVAGYTIAIRIIMFALFPAWGLANAAATLVGQNLGAKQPDRAERSAWVVGIANMIFLGLVSIVFIAIPDTFIGFFVKVADEPVVMQSGVTCLRVVSFGFMIFALGQVMINSINGAGDTSTPVWINFIAFWLLEIPLAYIFTICAGPPGQWSMLCHPDRRGSHGSDCHGYLPAGQMEAEGSLSAHYSVQSEKVIVKFLKLRMK